MPSIQPGPLARLLLSAFSSGVRHRGHGYFRGGAVVECRGDDFGMEAEVVGTAIYRVALHFDPGEEIVLASCTCPYFGDRMEPCKHLWAAVLEADRRGYLAAAGGLDDLLLVEDPEPFEAADSSRTEPEVELRSLPNRGRARHRKKATPPPTTWRAPLTLLRRSLSAVDPPAVSAETRILYVLEPRMRAPHLRDLAVKILSRERRANGEWGKPKPRSLSPDDVERLLDPEDREILSLLFGGADAEFPAVHGYATRVRRFALLPEAERFLVARMCATGRCYAAVGRDGDLRPLSWDPGPPWRVLLEAREPDSGEAGLSLTAWLARDGERLDLEEPELILGTGVFLRGDRAAPLEAAGFRSLVDAYRRVGPIEAPRGEEEDLIEELVTLPSPIRVALPERLAVEELRPQPQPRLRVSTSGSSRRRKGRARLEAEVTFDYAGRLVSPEDPRAGIYDRERRRLVLRDPDAERAAVAFLREAGFRPSTRTWERTPTIAPGRLGGAVRKLLAAGWHVEAEGSVYRAPGTLRVSVRSGVDWFELHGDLPFGDQTAALPELIRAASRGETTVRLGDGSVGVLPEDWLRRYGFLAAFGRTEVDHLRFRPAQAALLDALLAGLPEAASDGRFDAARERLRGFRGVEPVDPPPGFTGTLRDYQKEGLGWFGFLREFGFGGCLADDMGLGKTVQVLALLEARRTDPDRHGRPSLAVVPRSVLWNWRSEAERFTPRLSVHIHAGPDRDRRPRGFDGHDLVLTTYGTLRRDVVALKDLDFDFVILDEAQAVKNAGTVGAKAVRLLTARHRLALTGTPVENHLGELWSLIEFLNPGLLGSASGFRKLVGKEGPGEDGSEREIVARAVRPFLLRRTKAQVAPELPERNEQTLFCDLERKQRRRYDELRDHYRRLLLEKVRSEGLGRSKIQVLEALLRLRQAACHPGLLDPSFRGDPAAKLETLVPQLLEIADEGHKALVFSQFTRFLALLRERLDAEGLPYEYLDGRTRKREERVRRFQDDPDCPLFLISLKAGGVGLNLTAAEYVYLLDPWWNPAVEAQAIDRTHRIGQTRSVFAYRLIARDTVEERILELQEKKRDLAASIITADNSLIRTLRVEDLEVLLS